jgi:hypothetical protein
MAMDSRSVEDRDRPTPASPEPGEQLVTGGCEALSSSTAAMRSVDGARRVICARVRGQGSLPFLDRDQTVVGVIPDLPQPGLALRVYSAEGRCVLQSSRIRMLMHGPDGTMVVTRNSTYRITYVDDA